MSDLVLAIDQGTSLTKVLALDVEGGIVAQARADTMVRYPTPERAESDADRWWPVVAGCIRQVLARGVPAGRIRAIGVCGFMHTLVPVDASGRALHPAMLWPDQRCSAEVQGLAPYAGAVARITGRPLTTLSSLPRLRWLRANAPDAVRRAANWLLVKDLLRFHLTGEVATDMHDAEGTGLVDVAGDRWSEELLDLAGVPLERMPPIRRADDVAGEVTEAAAAETGLRPGTPVVIGSGDWFSTLVGSGCFLPHRTCFYLGSAGILGSFASEADLERLGATRYFGSVTSTGTALRWIKGLLYSDGSTAEPISYALVCAEGERSAPGARGLLFLPHLMGERGGRMRPRARGVLYGLTLAHDRRDVVRAVLEGTAMWLRATCEPHIAGLEIGDLVAFGGGARSPLWRRICAAVFERRLLVPESAEGAGLGAAMMAAVGCGLVGGYGELTRCWVKISRTEVPEPALVEVYRDLYERFRELESMLVQLS